LWRWIEKEELEKIMIDYVRWMFRLDYCTLRYDILYIYIYIYIYTYIYYIL